MAENEQDKEAQNGASAAEELAAIRAQLEAEQGIKAGLETAAAEKDSRITELETALSEAKQESEAKASELAASVVALAGAKEASEAANSRYREALVAGHPEIPQELIVGNSIDELFDSVEKGKGIVESVKKAMESTAAATKVPVGAPTRGAIPTEGMSPREKIAAGIRPK